MRSIFISLIRLYKKALSPAFAVLGAECRFYPTCSEYALQAFERLPAGRAFSLSLKRILKCSPWHEGGIDEVPII